MDYKKLHKDTITKLQEMVNSGKITVETACSICADFVPESEDESIRNGLIEYIKDQQSSFISAPDCRDKYEEEENNKYNSWIAWLEKQGEQKSIWHNEDEEPQRGSLILLIMQSRTPIVAKIIEPNHTFNHGERWAYIDDLLEKEGEKPADKVKPKFKVGDWCIDNEDGTIFQIVKVLDNTYTYKANEGKEYSCTHYSLENDARIWTIQDAKEGDVLFQDLMGGKTFIYNGINPSMAILYSFIISNDGEDVLPYHIGKPNTGIGNIEENKNIIHPATKEQRDLLFQKMKEAGYEWDAEKKELKKIHNALEECEIKNIEHGKYYYCIKDYFCGGRKQASKGDVVQALRGMSMMALGVKANEYFIPVNTIKQMSTWSEDDERIYRGLHNLIYSTPYCDSRKELSDWFKSLKERVQLQPKQEWSEEDEKMLNHVIIDIESLKEYVYCKHLCDEEITWLKSLKDRYTWKPSIAQLNALSIVSKGNAPDDIEAIVSLYQDLLKLREE